MKEAYLYKKLANSKVRCDLCSHRCVIDPANKGICGVRRNMDGTLYSLVYDKVISENVDPIEKKPLFHFLPGTMSLSIATPGCNFKCFFCHNWQISQMPGDFETIEGRKIPPEQIVSDARTYNCASISYTYTEPTIFFELAYDTSEIAHSRQIKNVFVTNGFMTPECLDMIKGYLDAANVDLKSFSDSFYRERAGGKLKPVLDNIEIMHELGIWIEVTTLLIPGLNDSAEELGEIASFLFKISDKIPWHVSAYFPQYKSDIAPTGTRSIMAAMEIGKKAGLKYVYGGNIRNSSSENTHCSKCGKLLLSRTGFSVSENNLDKGCCSGCGTGLDGVFIS